MREILNTGVDPKAPNPFKGDELFFNVALLVIALLILFFGVLPSYRMGNLGYDMNGYWWCFIVVAVLLILNYVLRRWGNIK